MRDEVKLGTAGIILCIILFVIFGNSLKTNNSGKPEKEEIKEVSVQSNRGEVIELTSRGGYVSELVKLYEDIVGKKIDTSGSKPMFEQDNEEIVKAWKIGIIEENDISFYYNDTQMQYQQAAKLLYETIISAKSEFRIDSNEARYILNDCYDNVNIEDENIYGYAFLYKYKIADRALSPDTFMDEDDIENLINKTKKIFVKNKSVKIGDREIYNGMSHAELIRTMGNPNRIDKSGKEFLWYVYNSNYANFIMVAVYDDVVTGFFTNSRNFKFGDIQAGSMYADVTDKDIEYYLDAQRNIDGIYYNIFADRYYDSKTSANQMIDIINAVRIKKGAGEIILDAKMSEKALEKGSDCIADVSGENVWDCYETLISAGYVTPFELGEKEGGYAGVGVIEKEDGINILMNITPDNSAKRSIETVQPEAKLYSAINEENSNFSLPSVVSPQNDENLTGDVKIVCDIGEADIYRLAVTDNETMEIIMNSYIVYENEIILPSGMFKEGGDYIVSVYTPDGEYSNTVEFAYGEAKKAEILSPSETVYGDSVDIMWKDSNYSEHLIELFNEKMELLASVRVSGDSESGVTGVSAGKYCVRVSSLKKNTNTVKTYTDMMFEVKAKDSDIIIENPPAPKVSSSSSSSSVKFKSDRYTRIFGPGGGVYTSKQEADANIVKITVPVWKISDGEKVASTADIMINRALAEEVYDIFYEIYLGSEKFPIKSVGAYSWRSTATGSRSQHSYGTAIDINANENYCIYNSGKKIGSFWKPHENPYSIPKDGDVVRAFKRYGWTWGAEWNSLKDYMHFSYLGG